MNEKKSLALSSTPSQRLHEQLGKLIAKTSPGDRLLSEPKLAKEFGVARATLREAMRTFEIQGLIHRRQGVGTFVAHPSKVMQTGLEVLESIHTLAQRINLPVQMSTYEIEFRTANKKECQILKMEPGQRVMRVAWVMGVEDHPVAYLIDILPDDLLSREKVDMDFDGSILDLLLQQDKLKLINSSTEINAVAANPEVAQAMAIQREDVVLFLEAVLYSSEGRPVDYSHSYFLPGYFRFHVNRRIGNGLSSQSTN